jgi:Raf kinase inhibitor-like YbhB/YbcL family protein
MISLARALCFAVILSGSRTCAADPPARTLQVTSPAFAEAGHIPALYTCDGQGWSPPLRWSGLPANTASVVVLVDDMEAPAGDGAQWIVYDLSPASHGLDEGDNLGAAPGWQGTNRDGGVGWDPICPDGAALHRYRFRVLALGGSPIFRRPPHEAEVMRALRGQVIARGQLVATYARRAAP